MENIRRPLKINVALQKKNVQKAILKSQDVFHNICRVRDSEPKKKRNIILTSKL